MPSSKRSLPKPEIEPVSLRSPALAGSFFTTSEGEFNFLPPFCSLQTLNELGDDADLFWGGSSSLLSPHIPILMSSRNTGNNV